jgi:hypothetical protein
MSFIWFIAWIIANNIGSPEPLTFDPVNWWAGALILAFALDVNKPPLSMTGKKK